MRHGPIGSPSITLVIKTPNQRVRDIEVSCLLDWTVEKLKAHLANVYPTKPVSFLSFSSDFALLGKIHRKCNIAKFLINFISLHRWYSNIGHTLN